jgi:hypothetical protein
MRGTVWVACVLGVALSVPVRAAVVPETSVRVPSLMVTDSSVPTPQVVGAGKYGAKVVEVVLSDSTLGKKVPLVVEASRLFSYNRLWYSNMDCTGTPLYIDAPEATGPNPTTIEAMQGVTYSVNSVNQVWRSTGSTTQQTPARVYVGSNQIGQQCFAWGGGLVKVRSVTFVDDLDNYFTPPYQLE